MTDAQPTGPFEYRLTPDTGYRLPTGAKWQGWRVQYRRPGVRRWTRFLLETDTGIEPTVEQMELVLTAHEKRAA